MTIKTHFNHPLMRELRELGVLSTDATPVLDIDIGPNSTFRGTVRANTEVFNGDGTRAVKVLDYSAVAILSAVAFPLDGTAGGANVIGLVSGTHYTLDGTNFTYLLEDMSAYRIFLTYTY